MKKYRWTGMAGLVSLLLLGGTAYIISGSCSPSAGPADLSEGRTISLPEPRHQGEVSVEEAIFSRRSVRSFSDQPLDQEEISQILWAAAGMTVDGVTGATRSYPSAGGVYPLAVYVVTGPIPGLEAGVYRYDWREHALTLVAEGDRRQALSRAALGQRSISEASVNLVFAADTDRTERRYGRRGRERYVAMDVGGAGQNVHLQAEALGLGTVIIGAFSDQDVAAVAGGTDYQPLYIMPLGRKR